MAAESMKVDPTHLHAGADRCSDAAGAAMAGAVKLATKKPTAGIFGDFGEAHALHGAISAAHLDHVEQLHGHHRALTEISDKSRTAAYEFTSVDGSTADSLRVGLGGL
jgi:Protein of unknown function (DUF2563)